MAGGMKGVSRKKRKPSEPKGPSDLPASKKAKLAEHGRENFRGFGSEAPKDLAHHLPAEIWHRIFTLLPPKTLGRLMTVNNLFRAFLDPSSPAEVKATSSPSPILPPLKPDAIWQASRRAFWPHMPGPLTDKSEVDMWRLCCSRTCQFCHSRDRSVAGKTQDQWTRGPGAKGVSPVFPFLILSCGKCLSGNVVKEVDILLSSSTPSFLLAGLPMVFMTPELHVISPQVLSTGTGSTHNQVAKSFFSTHIKGINAEFEAVKALGYAAAEEWIKGLEDRGKRSLADASRWERWYLSGGVYDMRASRQSLQAPPLKDAAVSSDVFGDVTASLHTIEEIGEKHPPTIGQTGGNKDLPKLRVEPIDTHSGPRARSAGQQRLTEGEATELKAKRKAEIERRALLLENPMSPAVLAHAPSFQAAVQITTPLDEKAWEILKPRLLDHREAAEQQDRENVANARAREAIAMAALSSSSAAQPQKEVTDKDWDEAQGPLRAKISNFADEIVRDTWNDGNMVSKKEASQFAVDVLHYVRARFYADVAEEAAATRAAGRQPITDPPGGPWTRKLTLENLKWVFDMKIKPHTDRHRKELFFCNGCDGNRKAFGLESAIQHYAAKHTTGLSVGNVVVHWRAEWPETSMFDPDPKQRRLRHSLGNTNAPSLGPRSSNGFNGLNAPLPANYAPYVATHQPYNNANQAPIALATHYPAAAAAPIDYAGTYPSQQYPPHVSAYPLHSQWPQYVAPYQSEQHSTGLVEDPEILRKGSNSAFRQAGLAASAAVPAASAAVARHANRLNFLTEIAEETWNKISHVKDLPDAAKAFVFIHQVTSRFEGRFGEATPLNLFFDALSNRKVVASARNLKGLRCQMCVLSDESGSKERTLHALVQHFMAKHAQLLGRGHRGGWPVNMIYVLDPWTLPTLRKASGVPKESLALVAEAFPQAFAAEPSSNPLARKQQRLKVQVSPQQKTHVGGDGDRRDSSSSDSYEPELHTEDIAVRLEKPEPGGIHAAASAANENGGPRNLAALDILDRPFLQPASVVYGRPDTPRQPRRKQTLPQRDGHRTPKTAGADLRPGGVNARRAAAPAAPAQREDAEFEMLATLESHLNSQSGHLSQRRPAGRVMHQNLGRPEYPPRNHLPRDGYEVAPTYPADHFHEPPHMVARPEDYSHVWYDRRSPRLAYPPTSSRQEGEHVVYRSYPDDLPARPAQTAEAYEIVEVRDPRGGYYIKLPVRRDAGAFHQYEACGMEPFHRHGPTYGHEHQVRQPTTFEDYRRPPPAHAPQRPPSAMDYEEYDPRYPASGGAIASSASLDPRFQERSQRL